LLKGLRRKPSLFLDLFKEGAQVVHLEGQEFLFLLSLLLVNFLSLFVSYLCRCDAGVQLDDSVGLAHLFRFKIDNLLLQIFLAVLSLQLFAHREGHRALVKSLVGLIRHFDVVPDSQEQEAPLRLVESHLADNLIEALAEQLFSDWAETGLAGLPLKKFLVEHFSKSGHIDSSGWHMAHILNEVLA
jgi:hypothetical protein